VVLQCSAINDIDASALDSLEAIDHHLRDAGIALHLSEVKGPVMDRLERTAFLRNLRGRIFLSHFQAVASLTPEVLAAPGIDASRGSGGHPLQNESRTQDWRPPRIVAAPRTGS